MAFPLIDESYLQIVIFAVCVSLDRERVEVDGDSVVRVSWHADVHVTVYTAGVTSWPTRTRNSAVHLSEQSITI